MRLLLLWVLNACRPAGSDVFAALHSGIGFRCGAACRAGPGVDQYPGAAGAGAPHLPITVLTLGIFYLVLNGLLFWLASTLLPAPSSPACSTWAS